MEKNNIYLRIKRLHSRNLKPYKECGASLDKDFSEKIYIGKNEHEAIGMLVMDNRDKFGIEKILEVSEIETKKRVEKDI